MKSLLVLAALLSPALASAAPVVVSQCGTTVVEGVLAADLDCSATPGVAVTLEDGGSLDLGGHTLTAGGPSSESLGAGVNCLGDCSVRDGAIVAGVPYDWFTNGEVYGVIVVWPQRGDVHISGVSISGFDMAATGFRMVVEDSTLTDNFSGLFARELDIRSTTITNAEINGHQSASGRLLTITDSTISGGGGVMSFRIEILRSSITGMRDSGVQASGSRPLKRFYAEDSVIDGNCVAMTSEHCGDILSTRRPPVLVNSTCSHSVRYNRISKTWSDWDVCTLD